MQRIYMKKRKKYETGIWWANFLNSKGCITEGATTKYIFLLKIIKFTLN